jgi:hypothetical protein
MFDLGMVYWGLVIYAIVFIGGYLIWAYYTKDE